MRPACDLYERPLIAIWEVTRACALRCLHCRADAVTRRDPRELTAAAALDLVEQLAELQPGILVLTGGDPLERPDLFAIIEAASRTMPVALAPSVTPRLTTEAIKRLAASGVHRIALSLDGPDPASHDALRGVPGSYAATLAAAAWVRAAGMQLQINSSLTKRTVADLPGTGRRVADLAPALWSVFVVVPVGRADRSQMLDAHACEAVFHYLADWHDRTGLLVKTTAAPAFRRVVRERAAARHRAARAVSAPADPLHPPDLGATPGEAARRTLAVNDGKGFVFISHTGEVYPSGFLPLLAGDVRRQRLATVYRTSPVLQALREPDLLGGKCGVCPYRFICGGSRARAFALTGDPLAEDPACAYVPPEAGDAASVPPRRGS